MANMENLCVRYLVTGRFKEAGDKPEKQVKGKVIQIKIYAMKTFSSTM